jgi:branched-chain amino acid transport system permease protein
VLACALIILIAAPFMTGAQQQMVCFAIISIALAQSLNILSGMTGQISLAHGAFMGIAAFTSVILVKKLGISPLLSIPIGAILSGLIAWLLSFPAARVKEFYLAMMSVGFGMIFSEIVREWESLTGGVMGITGVPSAQLGTFVVAGWVLSTTDYTRALVVFALVMLFTLDRFVRSRWGRALFALHVSEIAARSIGIRSGQIKRQAYLLSGILAGFAGALYAHLVSYIGPESFEIHRSIEILVMSVVGGLGSLAGQVLGGIVLTFLPLQLEAFADYKFIVYGVVLTLIFVVMPSGLAGVLLDPPRFIANRFRAQSNNLSTKPVERKRIVGEEILRWEDLRRDFAGLTAVTNFNFSLKGGEVVGLIGPNGSGKSTTINVVTGVYPPSAGRVFLKGQDISALPIEYIASRGMVRTFQDPRLVGRFTVLENVMLGAHLHQKYGWTEALFGLGRVTVDEQRALHRAEAALSLIDMMEFRDSVVDSLPYGYRRLVELARALALDPDVILLDEPGAGLSEAEIGRLKQVVRHLASKGVAVLIVDHHMDLLAQLVDSVVVLDSGEEIFRGSMDDMRSDPLVAECYLGTSDSNATKAEGTHA